jgi:Family of unknown function (DUF6519)/Chaperone of endosialidase
MKGDFTRFTFEPRKRYTSVLMQQGRLQLDADWNEQMSIQNYLQQRQAQDMIGESAGTPATEAGFQILPTPLPSAPSNPPTLQNGQNGEDLVIQFGRFYINGILCDFPVTSTFQAMPLTGNSNRARLFFTAMDGQRFQAGEWLELQPKGEFFKITAVDKEQRLLTFDRNLPENSTLEFRRITTYQTQIDYPAPKPIAGDYLVYLDVWQRHITAIDDPELREVALNVPDTTTRIKTLWQAKLLPIAAPPADNAMESVEKLPEWTDLIRSRQVELIASTDLQPDKPGISNNQGNYLGVENRLYRVEIHESGLLGKASFKWSRDNGSTVSAIASINGNVIKLKNTIQEAYKLFKQSPEDQPWVEILTEEQELSNQPGVLVQIIATKPPNQLIFETSQIRGGTLPQSNGQPLKVRRWDHTQDAVLMTSDQWIFLEDGIKIKFQTPDRDQTRYETGDYWLIPARNIDRSIQWKQDDQGVFLPQPPAGIQHQYGFLAAVHYDGQTFSPLLEQSWEQSDLRVKFLPLINRFQLGEGSLGVGIKPPWAKLHVKGAAVRSGKENLLTTDSTGVVLNSPKNDFRIYPGYTLIVNGETRVVTSIDPNDRTHINLNAPFNQIFSNETFDYQEPVLRFTTQSSEPATPEVFMDPAGRLGLGTQEPKAQFHLKQLPTLSNLPIARFETATQLGLLIDSQGNAGMGIEPTDAKLQVNGALKLGSASQHLLIDRNAQQVQFRTQPQTPYSFDQSVTIESGFLKVFGKAGIGSDVALGEIPENGLLVQGNLLARSLVSIGTNLTPANLQVKGNVEIGPVGNPLKIVVNDSKTEFSGTSGYEFSDRLTIRQGGCKITGDSEIAGKCEITNGCEITGGCEIAGGLNLSSGNLSIAGTKISFSNSTAQEIQSSDTTGISIVTANTDRLTIAPTGTILAQVSSPTTFFGIAGQAIVGQTFVTNASTATNGLLVEGHLGVGTNRPNAKLEVDGTTNNSQDFGLRIISNKHNLLSVQNQGIVGIGVGDTIATAFDSTLKVHGQAAIGKDIMDNPIPENGLSVQGDIRAESRIAISAEGNAIPDNVKLFVRGDAEIHGKISADDFTTGLFQQLSSRSLKDQINPLSSQASNQLLQNLNPVSYVYRADTQQKLHFGFIAEDVPDSLAAPDRHAIHPLDIVAVLTKAVQDQRLVIASLHRTVQSQQKAIALMNDRLSALENGR